MFLRRTFVLLLVFSIIGICVVHFMNSVVFSTPALSRTVRIENQRITSLRGKRKAKLNTLSSFQLYEKQAILPAIHKREHIQLLHNHNSNSIEITNRTDKVLDVLGDVGGVSNHNVPPKEEMSKGFSNFWSMTVLEREKFQQAQVDNFCKSNHLRKKVLVHLKRHILTNNEAKTLFCFAPKVGCTNLKILFFLTQGALPFSELEKSRDTVDQQKLEEAITKHSFTGLTRKRKRYMLKNYYKFVMYRNPIERLLSAYRSKVQRTPLKGLNFKSHYNWLKKEILAYKQPSLYKRWRASKGIYPINITFSDFIDYWLHKRGLEFDEHFQTIYSLCQPCQVQYNYYGNFNTFKFDSKVLISHIGSNSTLLRDGYYKKGELTSDISPQYFGELTDQQKELIINKLALDLSFYYSIFPTERDIHKTIMGTNYDIPNFHY